MNVVSMLLIVAVIVFAARHVLKYTNAGFCLRHGILEENLYVSLSDETGLADTPTVYERRVRHANIYGSSALTAFAIPLSIEEFRRVSARPEMGCKAVVSDWFKNIHEYRKDGWIAQKPLFDFRPLTSAERSSLWPHLLHETLQCERQLATGHPVAA